MIILKILALFFAILFTTIFICHLVVLICKTIEMLSTKIGFTFNIIYLDALLLSIAWTLFYLFN